MNCTTTSHYATHISAECSVGGSAQCDGFCAAHRNECTCSCHNTHELPQTVAEVRDWHDEQYGVAVSYEKGDESEQWSEAMFAAEVLNKANKPKNYAVRAGQGRTVVVESYS